MKARVRETVIEKAAKIELNKHTQEYADQVAQGVIALIAYLMYSKWHCGAETCRKRVGDIADMLRCPAIFGKDIHDYDYIRWCKETINLDVKSEIKLKIKIDYV